MGFIHFGEKRFSKITDEIFNVLSDAVVIADKNGRVIYANRVYRQFLSGLKSSPIKALTQAGFSNEMLFHLQQAALQNTTQRQEIRLSKTLLAIDHASRAPHWYMVETRPIKIAHDTGVLWRIADISAERDRQEQYFRDLQEAINHLDLAPAGFLSCDENGAIIYMNATMATLADIDLSRFHVGKNYVADLFIKHDADAIASLIADRYKKDFSILQFHLKNETQPVDVYALWQDVGQGDSICRMVVLPTPRQQQERHDETFGSHGQSTFLDYFSASPIAMATLDEKGYIINTNAPFLNLLDKKQDIAKGDIAFCSLIHPRDRERLARSLGHLLESQEILPPFDTVMNAAHSSHVQLYLSLLKGTSYGERAVVCMVETTEMRALEEQMAQTQKMQAVGQLAGGIAHDFNNVLTAIIMSCDLLLSSHRSSDPSHPDLMNIKLNANRAASLVQQLLAFSRRQTLRPQVVDLAELLSGILNMVQPVLGTHIKTEKLYARELWPVEVDKGSLDQVITNLSFNARDAMPNGGILTIRTRNVGEKESRNFHYNGFEPGDYVAIEVSDTGTGIPTEIKEKIFEPFFTTKEVGKGTGLGLSMVYGIIKQTGGYIYCDSEVGKGTSFTILLPRYIEKEKPQVTAPVQAVDAAVKEAKPVDLSGSATVLLVEDEDAVRMGGARALQSRGYTVFEAASGVEALEVMEEQGGKIDIVVSDVVMPEMDGPTLLRELRKIYPDIKFIFVSGYAKDAFAKNLPEDAEFGFLPKPFSLKDLASAVKDMLAR